MNISIMVPLMVGRTMATIMDMGTKPIPVGLTTVIKPAAYG